MSMCIEGLLEWRCQHFALRHSMQPCFATTDSREMEMDAITNHVHGGLAVQGSP